MKILCFYPGMVPELDDWWWVWQLIASHGHDVTIVCKPGSALKGGEASPGLRVVQGVVLDTRETIWEAAEQYAESGVDVVFASHTSSFGPAARLSRLAGRSLVVLLESWADVYYIANRRRTPLLLPIAKTVAAVRRHSYLRHAVSLVTCDPKDQESAVTTWMGWPVGGIESSQTVALTQRASRAVYVGSLASFKNSQMLPRVLDAALLAGVSDLVVVGPEVDVDVVPSLRRRYGQRLTYMERAPRRDVIELLGTSRLALTPCRWGGWGFIVLAWATGTPLLSLHNPMALRPGVDAFVLNDTSSTPPLDLDDMARLSRVAEEGYGRYLKDHAPEVVAKTLYTLLQTATQDPEDR